MILFTLLVLTAPASQPAANAITKAIADCGHTEGPLQLSVPVPGKLDKPATAYACTKKNKTSLLVFALQPKGDYTLACEVKDVPGVAAKLALVAGGTVVHLVTRVATPEEERLRDLAVRGCKTIAQTDVRHPADEDAMLREPEGGLVFKDGLTAWSDIVRLDFKLSLSERRRVAMARRGERIDLATGAREEIEQDAFDAIVLPEPFTARTLQPNEAIELELPPSQTVRGVRVRFAKTSGDFTVSVAETTVTFGPKIKWAKAPGVFGVGLIASSEVTQQQDAVAFFQPAVDAPRLTIKAGAKAVTLADVIVFADAPDWPLFEASEDFGEHIGD